MKNREKLVEVYRASRSAEAELIKGMLESYGIHCLLSSDASQSINMFPLGKIGEVKIRVWQSAAREAARLIAEESHA